MIGTMRHQEASESGTHFTPALGVYAGWVAHEKSFAARESSTARIGGTALMFAGECFPAMALRDRYEEEGDEFVGKLNGLFSGLLVDPARERALLFNDRFGSERLYIAESRGITYFASEAKALLRVLPELRSFDETGLAQFLAFGSIRDGHTLFRGIRLLPGGSLWIRLPGGNLERKRYFTPGNWERLPVLDDAEFESRFAETFRRVLPHYLDGDAPVGISLTAGLDTRMIMACLPCTSQPAVAYTYAAEGSDTLDVSIARRVAATRRVPYRALRIGSEFLANYGEHVDRTVRVTDGCAGALGAHEIYLSEQARQLAPVRLTGNYGSEVLRSMSTFRPLCLAVAMFDHAFAPLVQAATTRGHAETTHPVTQAVFQEVPWHLFGSLAAARSQLAFRTPYLDNEIVELAYRASARERQSAQPALRLIYDNDPFLAAIPTDRGLAANQPRLRATAQRIFCGATFKLDYWHKEGLPDSLHWIDPLWGTFSRLGLLGLHKFLPYRIWFRRQLAPYVREVVTDARLHRLQFLDPKALRKIADDHASGRANHSREINAALTLEAVDRVLLQERSA